MKKLFALFSVAVFGCGLAYARMGTTMAGWHQLSVGGSGFFVELGFSSDGSTKIVRNDSGDGYVWDSVLNKWLLLNSITAITDMPLPTVVVPRLLLSQFGVAPSNGNNIIITFGGWPYASFDRGRSFSRSNLTIDQNTTNVNGGTARITGPHYAYDPFNPDNVYYCSNAQGLWKSSNGGLTFALDLNLPASMPETGGFVATTASADASPGDSTINITSTTSVTVGAFVYNLTSGHELTIAPNTIVTNISGTTITLSTVVQDGGVGGLKNTDSLRFSLVNNATGTTSSSTSGTNILTFQFGPPVTPYYGQLVHDITSPSSIPFGTYAIGSTNTTILLSTNVTVALGDTIAIERTNGTDDNHWIGCGVGFDPTTPGVVMAFPSRRAVYRSTDSGTSWAATTGGPTSYPVHMRYDTGGTLWLGSATADNNVAGKSNFWKYSGGSWTQFTVAQLANGGDAVRTWAVDPANNNHVVIGPFANTSNNGGTTFVGKNFCPGCSPNGNRTSATAPWLAQQKSTILADGDQLFDPGSSNKLYMAEGSAVWWSNPPTTLASFNWTSQVVGADNPTPQKAITTPQLGPNVFVPLWDMGWLKTSIANSFVPQGASLEGPQLYNNPVTGSITAGWDFDWATSDPRTLCFLVTWSDTPLSVRSGCSSNGGSDPVQFLQDPMSPHMTLTQTANATDTVLHFANGIPDTVQANILVGRAAQIGPLTAISGTLTGVNPAILHFGPGVLTTALTTAFQPFTMNNVQQGTGVGNFSSTLTTVSCVNISGSDCAGTSAGDVTLSFSLGPLPIVTGDKVFFTHDLGNTIIPDNTIISSIDRVANTVTLNHPVGGTILAGTDLFFSYHTGNNGGGSIAAASPSNIVILPQNPGTGASGYTAGAPFPWYTLDGGNTWEPVVICAAGCTGFNASSVNGGAAIGATGDACGTPCTGWGGSYFTNTKQVTTDRVQANTFYLYNCRSKANGGGLYVNQNGGVGDWVRVYDNTVQISTCGQSTKIEAVPGHAGHVYISPGGGSSQVLYRTSNALCGTTNCSNMSPVTGIVSVVGNFGFGAAAPGKSYPTLWYWGKVGSTFGLYRATDADQASPTFVLVATSINNTFRDGSSCIEGDYNVYGIIYTCIGGTGWAWGYFPYLLKRDLDPAANDNSPAFMDRVA